MKRANTQPDGKGQYLKVPRFGTRASRFWSTQSMPGIPNYRAGMAMAPLPTDFLLPTFRLFNVLTEQLESWSLDDHPPYIAASHTWSENVFPVSSSFPDSFGGRGILSAIRERFPGIQHCWFDTRCIDQNDPDDKLEQIPLMDRIFGNATCVLIFISGELGADQSSVDWLAEKVEGALAMCLAEAWSEEGANWQSGPGRQWVKLAMEGLLKLASTSWATRIWTLQEYVLAKQILWIGTDLVPISIDDYAISALPDICNTLAIEECLNSRFDVLQGYFAGMANARLKNIDQTRIMELPGNRSASVAVDEVYGVMAASGVTLLPVAGETKGQAWSRWCVQAVETNHLRWALLPASSCSLVEGELGTCAFPRFSQRHTLSGISCLNSVRPIGTVQVTDGTVTTDARVLGSAHIVRRFGRLHEPRPGRIHRDITLILFAKGKWSLALKLAWICGGVGCNTRQARAIAQVLVQSHLRAIWSIYKGDEDNFRPMISSDFQQRVWNDFMELQQASMLGLQEGVGYLCNLIPRDGSFPVVPAMLVTAKPPPQQRLLVLDFDARTPDERAVLMIVQEAQSGETSTTLHKVGTTLPLPEAVARASAIIPPRQVRLGGYECPGCHESEDLIEPANNTDVVTAISRLSGSPGLRLRLIVRRQEALLMNLFSAKPTLTRRRVPYSPTRVQFRRLTTMFQLRHSGLQTAICCS